MAIVFAVKALLATQATPYVNMVFPAEERAYSPDSAPIRNQEQQPGDASSSQLNPFGEGSGAEASSSAPLQQQGSASHTNPAPDQEHDTLVSPAKKLDDWVSGWVDHEGLQASFKKQAYISKLTELES